MNLNPFCKFSNSVNSDSDNQTCQASLLRGQITNRRSHPRYWPSLLF